MESVPAVNPTDKEDLDVDSGTLIVQGSKSTEVAEKEQPLLRSQEESVSDMNGAVKNAESYKEQKSCCAFFTSKSKPGQPMNNFLELSLLKDFRFLSFCVAILLFTLAFQSAFVFLPAYGKQLGNTDMEYEEQTDRGTSRQEASPSIFIEVKCSSQSRIY